MWDLAPSAVLGDTHIGITGDYLTNFFSGGILGRRGKPLNDHTLAMGISSMALPPYKYVAYKSGINKEALLAMIMTGYAIDKTVHHQLDHN